MRSRATRRRRRTVALVAAVIAGGGVALFAVDRLQGTSGGPEIPAAVPAGAAGPYNVEHVVDGDTIDVDRNGQRVRVRLIGIDSPETVDPDKPVECGGPEASDRLAELVDHHQVYLEADPTQAEIDRYGRTLAYVWTDDGILTNLAQVQGGYAREYTYDDPYRYVEQFRAAESDARQTSLGVWSPACA